MIDSLIIKVKSGDSVGKTIRQLRENGYINSELRFKILEQFIKFLTV